MGVVGEGGNKSPPRLAKQILRTQSRVQGLRWPAIFLTQAPQSPRQSLRVLEEMLEGVGSAPEQLIQQTTRPTPSVGLLQSKWLLHQPDANKQPISGGT